MAWEINTKKVKEWDFPTSKKVKSITFADGRVYQFTTSPGGIPSNAIIVTDAQHSSLSVSTNDVSTGTSFTIHDYTRVGGRPTVNTPFVIYVKAFVETPSIQIKSSNLYFYDKNSNTVASFNNMQGKLWTIKIGHKYLFENGKDPVDLGAFGSADQDITTIKHTDYTSIAAFSNTIAFANLDVAIWDALNPTSNFPELPKPLIVEILYTIKFSSSPEFMLSSHSKGFRITLDLVQDITLLQGHKYKFEAGKLPIDLGTYDSATQNIPIIKASEYESAVTAGGEGVILNQINSPTWTSLNKNYAYLDHPIIIEFKGPANIEAYSGVNQIKSNGSGEAVLFNPTSNYWITMGHKYRFENGKVPVDLGTY